MHIYYGGISDTSNAKTNNESDKRLLNVNLSTFTKKHLLHDVNRWHKNCETRHVRRPEQFFHDVVVVFEMNTLKSSS
jgi:hypothetical protein